MKQLQQLEPGLNAFRVKFDPAIITNLQTMFNDVLRERLMRPGYDYLFAGMEQINIQMKLEDWQFHVTSYGSAPLLWISSNNAHSYDVFKSFMLDLDIMDDIKELVDFDQHIEVYCGFFVVGKKMDRETWHRDFVDDANGYTLITPLFELAPSHGNLMYRNRLAALKTYEYKMHEAIIFGEGFEHATQPYAETDELRVMLSLTFGTDKIAHWNTLRQTIGEQSNYMILPCGHVKGECDCLSHL